MSDNYRKTLNHDEAIRKGCHACKHYSHEVFNDDTFVHVCSKFEKQVKPFNTCDKWEGKK